MNIGVSTAPALPAGAIAIPGQQAAAGDLFSLLMGTGVQTGEAPAAPAAHVADIIATAEASSIAPTAETEAKAATVETVATAVKAADALVASFAPEEPKAKAPVEAKPADIAVQTIVRQAGSPARETASAEKAEKKDGRVKAKPTKDDQPNGTAEPKTATDPILIALPAVAGEAEAPATSETPVTAEAETAPVAATKGPRVSAPQVQIAREYARVEAPAPAEIVSTEIAAAVTEIATKSETGSAKPVAAKAQASESASVEQDAADVAPEAQPVAAKPQAAPEAERAVEPGKPAPVRIAAAKPAEVSKAAADPAKPATVRDVPIDIVIPAVVPTARQTLTDIAAPQAVQSAAAVAAAPADLVVDRQLDLVRNEQWLGELARDIAETSGDNNRLNFKLMPPQLGRLDVDLSRSHHGLSLTIRTETDSAQAILTAAQPRLVEEMRAQGVKLADTQMFSGDMRQSSNQGGQAQPAPAPIEAFIPHAETEEAAHEPVRDGRYA